MRIKSIQIGGFGCLIDKKYDFSENKAVLIAAENESGKSTLAFAVFAGLCGFNNRKTSSKVYKPWDFDNYSLQMTLEIYGQHIIVERNFNTNSFCVRDVHTNKDISSEYESDLSNQFLKLPREDFQRLAFISNKIIAGYTASSQVTSQLSALVDDAKDSAGADVAIEALNQAKYNFENKSIQPETAEKRILEQIAKIKSRLYKLDSDLDKAGEQQNQLEEAKIARDQTNKRIEMLSNERTFARLNDVCRRIEQANDIQNQINELENELETLSDIKDFPFELRNSFISTTTNIESLDNRTSKTENEFREYSKNHDMYIEQLNDVLQKNGASSIEEISVKANDINNARQAKKIGGKVILFAGAGVGIACIFLFILHLISMQFSFGGVFAGIVIFVIGLFIISSAKSMDADKKVSLEKDFEQAQNFANKINGIKNLLNRTESELADLEIQYNSENETLISILAKCGINSSLPIDKTKEEFDNRQKRYERFNEIRNVLLPEICKHLISEDDLASLIEEKTKLESSTGSDIESSMSIFELDEELKNAHNKITHLNGEVDALNNEVGVIVSNYKLEYPVLANQLVLLENELNNVTRFKNAVNLAADVLKEVSQVSYRRWASVLNDYANEILPNLNPDYDTIKFDDNLNFTLKHLSTNKIIDKNQVDFQLSTGAKDQIYLAARFAICRELSKNETLPIILDDPFIATDDERFISGFRYIIEELSKENQVIILTCHKSRHNNLVSEQWFKENCVMLDL